MDSKMAFASLTVEEMVRTFNKVLLVLRTTTILIGKEKVPNNLQVIEYLAEFKIMTRLKFQGSMADVNWGDLGKFVPDAKYWNDRNCKLEDNGETMTVDHEGTGMVNIPKGLHADGTPFTQDEINFKFGAVYDAWEYMLKFNEKALELIKGIVNIKGLYDKDDTFAAAAIVQSMVLEIHLSSRVGTSEILARATTMFSKLIVDHIMAEQLVEDFQTIRDLINRSSANCGQVNARTLLTRMTECLLTAMQMGAFPANVNPQRYSMMIAGIVEISKIEHEDRKFSYSKKLRSLLGLYMREFEHTKKL